MARPALKLKYVKLDENGRFRYRRRVPKSLHRALGKAEFSKVLGISEREATLAYGEYHRDVERQIALVNSTGEIATPLEHHEHIKSFFRLNGLTPHGPGATTDEKTARREYSEEILNKYPLIEETGAYEGVSEADSKLVVALRLGADTVQSEPTVTDAFHLYLKEKMNPDPFKQRKNVNNFRRIEEHALAAFGSNLPITKIKRSHARALRDRLLKRMKPASARRQINNIKAVINFAAREYDLAECTCFRNLEYPEASTAPSDLREPLPTDIIDSMYEALQPHPTLLEIWTLMHHTGAQNAEILGLHIDEISLGDDVPHIEIKPNSSRGLKDSARRRKVPLAGSRALKVAKDIKARETESGEAFPKFAKPRGHDNFSNQLMRILRRFTPDRKHGIYSLRHNMKDSLRAADVSSRLQDAILGHSLGSGAQANYGSGFTLQKKQAALRASLKGWHPPLDRNSPLD
ncbi:hypothetical protein DSM110093_00224 [Sulfitobacter sp. DSM 110093]|uniref:hypothetical protein n=1 Tax=Sulfitobacter sp. DSM 110093 TaxID=2883127 RepID=UPI001FAB3EDA|nr:hypothetical protein [Sulfitobacter sp. DSM 110093]UOA30476.1 hypothetical protein DSM110093_00224 [Sulfitobacter sp. DSM 110093]